jgi:beta-glucosidase
MQKLSTLNSTLFHNLEKALLPPKKQKPFFNQALWFSKKIFQVTYLTPLCTIFGSIEVIVKVAKFVITFFASKKDTSFEAPTMDEIAKDPRKWASIDSEKYLSEHPLGENDPSFQYGIATCTYQDSGYVHCPDSQWADWEKKCLPESNQSKKSANLFHLYKINPEIVIDRLKKLGVTDFRLSIEWSQIEPKEGEFHEDVLNLYIEFIRLLRQNGIRTDLTLLHFSEPKWFHEKGSFLNEENLHYFERFTQYVADGLSKDKDLIKTFWTMNEPGIEAFSRYIRGAFSPGESFKFNKAAKFLSGSFKAHNLAYDVLHKTLGDSIEVGFTHQYLRFIPKNPFIYLASRYLNKITNSMTLQTLKKGVFKLKIPFVCNVSEKLEIKNDKIGVQVYTRPVIGFKGSESLYDEAMTLMPFREDPAAAYEAVKKVSEKANCAVTVTETGISTGDESQRKRFMSRVLYSLAKAKEAGISLNGLFMWTFTHQLEWDMGMNPQRFSAYALEPDGSIAKTYREGVKPFVDTIAKWKTTIGSL